MREFNVTGLCIPKMHYMADTSDKIHQIMAIVEQGHYFTINRGRQYGKTTTLSLLEKSLPKEYTVIKVSFEGVSDGVFDTESNFCQGLLYICSKYFSERNLPGADVWVDNSVITFDLLDAFLNKTCLDKKIVLMIDEVDKTSNNFIFLKFLGMLRDKYLKRNDGIGATFKSVILAGVYDIKNLKLKMIQAGTHQLQDGEKRINSPWNIAVSFKVDMSLNEKEIASMLLEYENDHKIGMDIESIAREIRAYTNGYPFLVSRLCQIMDEDLEKKDWTANGVRRAVKIILNEPNLLFDDLGKNMVSNKELSNLLYDIAINGQVYGYNLTNPAMELGFIFGFLKKQGEQVAIDNLIFESVIYSHFMTEKKIKGIRINKVLPNEIIEDGKFDMELCVDKFVQHYYELYRESGKKFLEDECRMLFLTYLKPLINGAGFYRVESETRNAKRMDVVVDYKSEQFIVELKLWYGEMSHEKALEQIVNYLGCRNKDTGYLLTFDFRKEENVGKPQIKWVEYKGKKILDVMVGF
ncbi:MAG: AAA-like domain-containing protein [Fibromonadaceae bacterium]|jgi:hypothetical protein|nr:AAA-like domain-containing protein [Fibromonadaceae bacterium]